MELLTTISPPRLLVMGKIKGTYFQTADTTSTCYIILNMMSIKTQSKLTYSADSSSSINNEVSSIVNDSSKLLTFALQLHIGVFNLHMYTIPLSKPTNKVLLTSSQQSGHSLLTYFLSQTTKLRPYMQTTMNADITSRFHT